MYDVFDRRIAKRVDTDGSGPQPAEETRFVYDAQHVWADFDAANLVTGRYLFGEQTDQILARFRPGEGAAWYLTDHLDTVRDIVDSTGTVIDHIDYDSFGNVILETDATAGDRYTFTGRELDAETGLYYYRARYYDATIGRFTSEDPLGLSAGDANLYRYVGNSPLNFTDPTGEESVTEGAATQQTTLPLILHKANCLVDSTVKDLAVGTLLGGPALGALDVSFNIVSCGIFPTSIRMQATFLRLSGDLAVKLKRAASAGAEVVVELAGKHFKGTFVASAAKRLPAVIKAVNSDIIHAGERAVARGLSPDTKSAANALRELSKKITAHGLPPGTIPDPKRADSVLVPFGEGHAVYEITKKATAILRTVLGKGV